MDHEAENDFHSLQQIDAKEITDVLKELKLKYGEERNTKDQICPKCGKNFDSFSQGVYEEDNGLLQVYTDDRMFCENCLKKDWESNYPASRGPSIFLDKSGLPRKIEGPLLAG